METIKTFENEFLSLCELLGENSSKLFMEMGQYEDIDANDDRTFVSYKKNYSQFGYNEKNIFYLSMPKIDSFGHSLQTKDEYFTFKGLKLGMTKDEVLNIWGEPESKGEYYWNIGSFETDNGNEVNVSISFDENEENNEYYLTSFIARLVKKEPFDEFFLNICGVIGLDEKTIIDTLGNPDKTQSSSDGSLKILFYLKKNFYVSIDSQLGVAKSVITPINLTNEIIESEYYSLHGVYLGYSKDDVYHVWGNPTEASERNWIYSDKTITTSYGKHVEIVLAFKDGILEDFSGNLILAKAQVSKPKSGCFIATACYGDYNSTEVIVLRNYRDNVLLKTNFGKIAVDFYYFVSPPIAKFLEKSESLKAFVRKNILAHIILRIKHNQK